MNFFTRFTPLLLLALCPIVGEAQTKTTTKKTTTTTTKKTTIPAKKPVTTTKKTTTTTKTTAPAKPVAKPAPPPPPPPPPPPAAKSSRSDEMVDAKSFYHQSYNTRNSGAFSKDHRLLSFTYGFPNWLYNGFSYSNGLGIGPLIARFEMPVRDEVGVTVLAQVAARNFNYGGYTDHAFGVGIGAIGNYHFNKLIPLKKLDVYAGAGFSVTRESYNYDDNYGLSSYSNISVSPIGVAGARYYFTPKFAGFGEVGYTGLSSINLGVTFNLNP